jgi:hypothetical protein
LKGRPPVFTHAVGASGGETIEHRSMQWFGEGAICIWAASGASSDLVGVLPVGTY